MRDADVRSDLAGDVDERTESVIDLRISLLVADTSETEKGVNDDQPWAHFLDEHHQLDDGCLRRMARVDLNVVLFGCAHQFEVGRYIFRPLFKREIDNAALLCGTTEKRLSSTDSKG